MSRRATNLIFPFLITGVALGQQEWFMYRATFHRGEPSMVSFLVSSNMYFAP
jgi:hypothetical protein